MKGNKFNFVFVLMFSESSRDNARGCSAKIYFRLLLKNFPDLFESIFKALSEVSGVKRKVLGVLSIYQIVNATKFLKKI